MGQTHPTHTIHNRHFTSLQLKTTESPEESRLVGTVTVSSSAFLDTWAKQWQRARKEEYDHMLLPLEWKVAESSLCGSGKLIELQYQLFHRLLCEEAQLRSEQNRHFEQSQIWYIVWALTEVSDQCNKNGGRLTEPSLHNIFMNQTGNIKILTSLSLPDAFDPYFEPSIKDVYFSPEELKCRQLGQMHNESDSNKSLSFATGMMLLELSLLKPLNFLYDYEKNTLDTEKLQEQFQNLTKVQYLSAEFNIFQFYSQSYQRFLRKLLELNPDNRIILSQVYENLKPHFNQIATLKSFDFQVPQPLPSSPLKQTPSQKETISLRSHKLKKQSLTQSPPISETKQEKPNKPEKPKPEISAPLVESYYVAGSPEVKLYGSGMQLLRRIDERLQRSREEFPS